MKPTLVRLSCVLAILAVPVLAEDSSQVSTITGKIMFNSGALPRTKVELVPGGQTQAVRTTVTGPDGKYSFTKVPYGVWQLKVTDPSGADSIYKVAVDSESLEVSPIALAQSGKVLPLRWAAYGFEDSPGVWSRQYFKLENGGTGDPQEGDTVVALTDIFARKDYLHFDVEMNAWPAFSTQVGIVKKGQKVTVKKVASPKDPADTSVSKYVWIAF